MNRLDVISHNNKRNRVRDVMFACFITLAAALAITTATNVNSAAPISQR